MRHCEALMKHEQVKQDIAETLSNTSLRKNGSVIAVEAKATSSGQNLWFGTVVASTENV